MQISEWLQESAADVMVTNVFSLQPGDTLSYAAQQFLRHQISGAPVVDEGRCVGVLSVTDMVTAEEKVAAQQERIADEFLAKSDLILPVSVYEQELAEVRDKLTPASEQPVSNLMVKDLVTVSETDPLDKVVRSIVDAHVHRILVTDEEGKLCGIISTIDVMASLLRAAR